MQTELKSLAGIPTSVITGIFNEAFSDYIVPFKLTEQQLIDKIKSENIQLDKSAGVFNDNNLVGFILIGIDVIDNKPVAYNAGTGVIPSSRGNKLTQKMYEYLLPALKLEGITEHRLEVITTNTKAVGVYEKIGFTIVRELRCFKGIVQFKKSNKDIEILQTGEECIDSSFWNCDPSYQHSINAIKRDAGNHLFFSAVKDGLSVGYLVYAPTTGKVKQFAVDINFRSIGIGNTLFSYLQQQVPGKEISIINIDAADTDTINFLRSLGLPITVSQYEMKKQHIEQTTSYHK